MTMRLPGDRWKPNTPYDKYDVVHVRLDGEAKLVPGLSMYGGGPIIVCVRGGITSGVDHGEHLARLGEILYQSDRKTIPGPNGTRIWSDEDIAWAETQVKP